VRIKRGNPAEGKLRSEELRSKIFFVLLAQKRTPYVTPMTTQQKITAIRAIVANHQDNVAAMRAANVGQGLEARVIEAMNTAFKDDLTAIFAANASQLAAGNQPMRATAQNVRRRRQT
jgi:hypothetical protein